MDYDDNDYQSQNFHLVGDDSSKVSSVLCPYALPKFDLDESLQGNLRFDNLVENEVFLGIPSQEDNQWIEEYSRGSSGIEFSPSAAESCTFPRHNNVWSEAASSESVEMLLKSVVQEHNLPVDVIEESDAGKELGNSTQEMEPNLKQDDKVDHVKYFITSVQPDDFSSSKETTEVEAVQMALETQMVETCANETIKSRESDHIMTEENLQIEVKNNDSNESEVDTLESELLVNQTKGNPSASGVQIQSEEFSSRTVTLGNSSEWDTLSEIHLETTSGLPDYLRKGVEDTTIVNEEITNNDEKLSEVDFQTDFPAANKDSLPNVTSEVGVNEARGENTITNLGESSTLLGIVDHGLSTAEVCKKDVPLVELSKVNKSDIIASPKTTEIQHQCNGSTMLQEETSGAFKSTNASDRHVAEVRSVEGLEACSNLELEKCSAIKIPDGQNIIVRELYTAESSVSPDQGLSFARSGRLSEPFGPEIESSIDQGDSLDSLKDASIPAGILGESDANEDLEGRNDGVGADKVVSNIGYHVSSLDKAECVQVYKENVPSELPFDASNSDKDASSGEEVRATSCVVLSNVEKDKSLDPQLGIGSSSTVEEHRDVVETTCALEFATSEQNNQASDVVVKDAQRSLHDPIDNVNSISKSSDVPFVMVNHPEQKPSSVKEGLHFGSEEERNTISPTEANPSVLDSSIGTPVGQVTSAYDVGQDCSTDIKIRGGQHDSLIEEGTADKTLTAGKHEEANNDGENLPKSGAIRCSVESVAPTLVSAVATNCPQLLQTENKQEFGNGSAVESVPPPFTDSFSSKVQSTCMYSAVSASPKEERSSHSEVTPEAGSSEVETTKVLQTFPSNRSSDVVTVGEGLPLKSVGATADTRAVQEAPQVSDQITPSGGSKASSEHKTRRGSSKAGRKSTKGNQLKETPVKLIEKRDKSRVTRESSGTKTSGIVSTPIFNLPDLNTSNPSLLFRQPFTDLQQVQLRAQIFVYGSLIQGAVPDEACMLSAFGTNTEGTRSMWEPAWRACVERLHEWKSHVISTDTPMRSHSGAKTPDQAIKKGLQQSKALSSPPARSSSTGSSTPAVTPMIPLSSPLWNVATPSCDSRPSSSMVSGAVVDYQSFSSLHPYQIPAARSFAGHSTWLSQTSLHAPWVASPQTAAFDVSACFPVLPITEPVKLTPNKESSGAASAAERHMPTSPMAPSVLSGNLPGNTPMIENNKALASPADLKSRKRKKPSGTDGLVTVAGSSGYSSKSVGLITSVARSQPQTLSAPVVSSHYSTLVAVTTSPSFVPELVASSSLLVDHSKRADINVVKNIPTAEDIKNVEEATLQAEEASAHAATALGHCQGIWIELDKQKSSGLMPDVEAKLASAAVVIAAAASVAKAAAAAAKVASDAAAQVKQIADDAIVSSKSVIIGKSAVSLPNSVSNLGNATPASILKGGGGNLVSVEAMSAASRHTENLRDIVKAAELAAEAVSHAGNVVMRDPLPLSELLKAGPDGFWKVSEPMSGVKSKDLNREKSDVIIVERGSDVFPKWSEGPAVEASHAPKSGLSPHPGGTSANTREGSVRVEEGISSSIVHSEKYISSNDGHNTSERRKALDVSTGPEVDSRSTSLLQGDSGNIASSIKNNSIKEGCLVEVRRESDDLKAWFSANVLSLKDGNAFISYTDLQSDEGSALKDWIPLHVDGEDVPRIRISHPMTAVHFDGARKRRRAAVKDYTWSVGDLVDAWMHNCWREGIITEKNKKDETILSVNFPGRGDSAVVRAWNLRPTLNWKDGEWVEWSTSSDKSAFQGDTPKEKRMKLGNPAVETSLKDKLPINIELREPGTNKEPNLLPLSDNEKIFNVGSNNQDGNKPNTLRTMRYGLQKEGSKVVFGVPKPGKKRKFMEVNWGMKNNNAVNDSAKFGGWKNTFKPNANKEKEEVEFKPRPLRSRKPPISSSSRTSKDNSMTSNVSASMDTMSYGKNGSGQPNIVKCSSNSKEAAEGHMQLSTEALPTESRNKKVSSTSRNKSEKVNERNAAPASGKSTKVEVDSSIPEVNEPRRSNRRIQPTSRLLEGLQSSLLISKFPSVSYNKGHRSHHSGTSKGNNSRG